MALQHLRRDAVARREADEDVRALQGLGQRARVGLRGEALLVRVHALGAALVDHALDVAHDDVLAPHAQPHVVRGAGERRRARAAEHDLHLVDAACRRAPAR